MPLRKLHKIDKTLVYAIIPFSSYFIFFEIFGIMEKTIGRMKGVSYERCFTG